MRIKTRLFLGFGILIFLMFALAGIGIDRLSKINNSVQDVIANRYAKVNLANGMRMDVYDMAKHVTNMVIPGGKIDIQQEIQAFDKSQAGATDKFAQLTKLSEGNLEEMALITKVNEEGADFTRYEQNVLGLVKAGKSDEAVLLRATQGLTAQENLQQRLTELSAYHQQKLESTMLAINEQNRNALMFTIGLTSLGLLIGLFIMFWIIFSITGGIDRVSRMIAGFARGELLPLNPSSKLYRDEIGEVAVAFHKVAADLNEKTEREQQLSRHREEQNWLHSNLAQMTTILQGVGDISLVCQTFISEITPMVGASFGAIYVKEGVEQNQRLNLYGSYAFNGGINVMPTFRIGEGLVGQCALDREAIRLDELPQDYLRIESGLGEIKPVNLFIQPVQYESELVAVFEIASLKEFTPLEINLVQQLSHNVGILLNDIIGRKRVEELLRISQTLTEELQSQSEELLSQQEELRASNEKLEEQTKSLQHSEEMLQRQQAELEFNNEELTQKSQQLELKVWETEQINKQIERTRAALERQALQLATSSKYKSEFLANMSHELRTPLNSMLILSQLLGENKDGNLTAKQVEFANTIHSSGFDLLKLIDEILDLSKVEAGRMEINPEYLVLRDFEDYFERNFQPIAKKNGVSFHFEMAEGMPETIYTDGQRLQQILKNLLSNAFKFTKEGTVTLRIEMSEVPSELKDHFKDAADKVFAFSVIDTGIGIPADKLELIFEAFQQADGTTSRKYGGTGLGLSISRQLAELLGGTIDLESREGEGSRFTLYLPEADIESFRAADTAGEIQETGLSPAVLTAEKTEKTSWGPESDDPEIFAAGDIEDDRSHIEKGDRLILIIEDDPHFAKITLEMARARGFKGIVAMQGDKGLAMAREYHPDAIILDIQLPVMDGWSILNHLKHNISTRHIPVHVMSVVDESQHGLTLGAISYLKKPISHEHLEEAFLGMERFLNEGIKRLLIVEDDEALRTSLVELIGHDDVAITAVSSGEEALRALKAQTFDCMVLDLGLKDVSGFDLLNTIRKDRNMQDLPIIIYTGKELDKKEEQLLKKYAESIIIKNVKSPERLFDETALFLHRVESRLPEDKRKMLESLHSREAVFNGKSILLVDDDIRNVFALSSTLENYNMNITFAENGKEALDILEKNKDFDLILMDIMMPEMDGYDAMRAIRSQSEFDKLPIIALTAKAMKEDRNKCIEAGASDYITKPINTEQLLSLLKVWLYK